MEAYLARSSLLPDLTAPSSPQTFDSPSYISINEYNKEKLRPNPNQRYNAQLSVNSPIIISCRWSTSIQLSTYSQGSSIYAEIDRVHFWG